MASSIIANSTEITHELFFDEFGIQFNIALDETGDGMNILLEDHIDTLIAHCRSEGDSATLYDIGHEFRRYSETLLDAADNMIASDPSSMDWDE